MSSRNARPRQRGYFDLSRKKEKCAALERETQSPDFWNDSEHAQTVTQRLSALAKEVDQWEKLQEDIRMTRSLAEDADKENDDSLDEELEKKTKELQDAFASLEFFALFTGEYDEYDAIVSISAGAGGTDAQDWAEMVMTMLFRYAEKKEFQTSLYDLQRGQEAGIKSATFEIRGQYAYGWLKSEPGVHRLVRISPFDAEAMRHTSFALVDVIPDFGDATDIEIRDEDVRVDVFRASGHGGQSVNTTDSAVRIVHIPTNVTVTCQNERSQQQNKAAAMRVLKSRLASRALQEREKKERAIRGDIVSAEWGSQIRSYVLHPYKLVKDHRTDTETADTDAVLGGDIGPFAEAYLKLLAAKRQ